MRRHKQKWHLTSEPRCLVHNALSLITRAQQQHQVYSHQMLLIAFQDIIPLWRRNSPAVCFLPGGLPLAFSAVSLCFAFTLNKLIIFSEHEKNTRMKYHYKYYMQWKLQKHIQTWGIHKLELPSKTKCSSHIYTLLTFTTLKIISARMAKDIYTQTTIHNTLYPLSEQTIQQRH